MPGSDERPAAGTEQLVILPRVGVFLGNAGELCASLWCSLEIKLILRVKNASDSAEPPGGLCGIDQLN